MCGRVWGRVIDAAIEHGEDMEKTRQDKEDPEE